MDSRKLIRYGEIVADDELYSMCSEYADSIRIIIARCGGSIYRIKRINGEDEEMQFIGYERYEE